ncbi:MAG: ATP-binding protein [Terriglobia bacterium]
MNGVELFVIVILVGLSCFLYFVSWRARKKAPGTIKLDLPQPAEEVPQPAAEPPDPDLATPYEIATSLADFYEDSAHPDAFLSHPKFLEGVTLLNQGGYSNRDLVSNYHGDNVVAACMALEAYAQRDDEYDLADAILANINAVVPWTRYFALRALNARSPQNGYLIGGVLARIDESWRNPLNLEYLRDFLKVRLEAGEEWDFLSEFRTKTEAHIGLVGDVLEGVKGEAGNHLRIRYDAWRRTRTDLDFLGSVGLVWGGSDPFNHDPVIEHEELLDQVETVETEILKSRPRSVLLVGDSGVGKSTLVRVLGKRLQDKGWHIFEAGHTELVAGKIYIGEVEERLRKMLHHLGEGRGRFSGISLIFSQSYCREGINTARPVRSTFCRTYPRTRRNHGHWGNSTVGL